jgi:hypothetical protein
VLRWSWRVAYYGITGRDIARTRAAAAEVAAASGNPAVDPFPADMSSRPRCADWPASPPPCSIRVVRTGFAAEDPSPMWKLFLPLIRRFLKTPEKGAATLIYLASSTEVKGVTSTYFAARKPKASSPASHDTAAAARLWQISLDLVARTP